MKPALRPLLNRPHTAMLVIAFAAAPDAGTFSRQASQGQNRLLMPGAPACFDPQTDELRCQFSRAHSPPGVHL
jgi:hypothetical protein